jgi:hypothetical protein
VTGVQCVCAPHKGDRIRAVITGCASCSLHGPPEDSRQRVIDYGAHSRRRLVLEGPAFAGLRRIAQGNGDLDRVHTDGLAGETGARHERRLGISLTEGDEGLQAGALADAGHGADVPPVGPDEGQCEPPIHPVRIQGDIDGVADRFRDDFLDELALEGYGRALRPRRLRARPGVPTAIDRRASILDNAQCCVDLIQRISLPGARPLCHLRA